MFRILLFLCDDGTKILTQLHHKQLEKRSISIGVGELFSVLKVPLLFCCRLFLSSSLRAKCFRRSIKSTVLIKTKQRDRWLVGWLLLSSSRYQTVAVKSRPLLINGRPPRPKNECNVYRESKLIVCSTQLINFN